MSGSTFAFPAALTWVTDATTRATKLTQVPLPGTQKAVSAEKFHKDGLKEHHLCR